MLNQNKTLCVLGLGYVGLPTASMFATHGFQVIGVDVDSDVVKRVNSGAITVSEPGLRTLVQAAIKSGQLKATHEPVTAEAYFIAVPTPLTKGATDGVRQADLGLVESAARDVASVLRPGALVVIESTCPPGTTSGLISQVIESVSGLVAGRDYHLAYCPERVLPGRMLLELVENPRIVGGVTPESAEAAAEYYRFFVEGELVLTDSLTAEVVKLTENTYRDYNIAFANEMARICEHLSLDVWDVLRCANMHPRVHLHRPGAGVGGHCVNVDPWFLINAAPEASSLLREARLSNARHPQWIAGKVVDILRDIERPRVAILGVAYKANVDDLRESPVFEVMRWIEKLSAHDGQGCMTTIVAHDPLVSQCPDLVSLDASIEQADLIVIGTPHRVFAELRPQWAAARMRTSRVLDLSNLLVLDRWQKAGFDAYRLGKSVR